MATSQQETPTVKIAEEFQHLDKPKLVEGGPYLRRTDNTGGVFNVRSRSHVSLDRGTSLSILEAEQADEWQGEHVTKKQVFHGTPLFWYFFSCKCDYHYRKHKRLI